MKVFKEKCDLNHLQDLTTMPTVTVMAKWFMVDKLARISASNLVISLVIHVFLIIELQIAPLYEKLKDRLYNSFYRRQKRLEKKYNGDISKVREELGVDVPLRTKRRRLSKKGQNTNVDSQTSQTEESGTVDDQPTDDTRTLQPTASTTTNGKNELQEMYFNLL